MNTKNMAWPQSLKWNGRIIIVGFTSGSIPAIPVNRRLLKNAKAEGIKVIIAGAGGAAHLPGMVAAMTTLPVLAVPVKSSCLSGLDCLLSIVQMPGGVPVGPLAIGPAGAKHAALLACQILSLDDEDLANRVSEWRQQQTENVADLPVKLATE